MPMQPRPMRRHRQTLSEFALFHRVAPVSPDPVRGVNLGQTAGSVPCRRPPPIPPASRRPAGADRGRQVHLPRRARPRRVRSTTSVIAVQAAGRAGDIDRGAEVRGSDGAAYEVHWGGRMQKAVVRAVTADTDGAPLLRVETYVGGDGLVEGMRRQALLLQALSRQLRGRVVGVRDLSAAVDRDEAWMHRLAIGSVAAEDAIVTVSEGEGTWWTRTHGAARFDVPDLELYGLSRAQVPGAEAVLAHVHGQLLRHGLKSQPTLPDGTVVYLVPVLEAWTSVPLDWPGVGRAGKDRGHGLDGPRATLSVLHKAAARPLQARPVGRPRPAASRRLTWRLPGSSTEQRSPGSIRSATRRRPRRVRPSPRRPRGAASPHSSRSRGAPSSGPIASSRSPASSVRGAPSGGRPTARRAGSPAPPCRSGSAAAARPASAPRPGSPAATSASATISSASDSAAAMIGCGGPSSSMTRHIDWAESTIRSDAEARCSIPRSSSGSSSSAAARSTQPSSWWNSSSDVSSMTADLGGERPVAQQDRRVGQPDGDLGDVLELDDQVDGTVEVGQLRPLRRRRAARAACRRPARGRGRRPPSGPGGTARPPRAAPRPAPGRGPSRRRGGSAMTHMPVRAGSSRSRSGAALELVLLADLDPRGRPRWRGAGRRAARTGSRGP